MTFMFDVMGNKITPSLCKMHGTHVSWPRFDGVNIWRTQMLFRPAMAK